MFRTDHGTFLHTLHTKIAGVTFEGRQETVKRLSKGHPLIIERDPDNEYDRNAVAVLARFPSESHPTGENNRENNGENNGRSASPEELQVGFLNRELASQISPFLAGGGKAFALVSDLTGGVAGREHRGVNIILALEGRQEQLGELFTEETLSRLVANATPLSSDREETAERAEA